MAAKIIPLWVALCISAGMTALSAGVSYLMRPKAKLGENKPNEYGTNIIDTDAFVPIAFGHCVVPTLIVFMDTDPDNINSLYGVAVTCMGPIEDYQAIYFDNMETVARQTNGSWDFNSNYEGLIRFERRKGTANDATTKRRYEEITKKFKTWTSKHLSAGVASFSMKFTYNQDRFNSLPAVYARGKFQKVYDPRDATEKYSNNPILCLLHYLRDTIHGKGLSLTEDIITDSFIAEANYCEERIEYGKVDPPEKITTIYLIPKEKDNPFTSGSTYHFKYSWGRGTVTTTEDDSYTYSRSALSAGASAQATSAYGRFKLSSIDAPSEEDDVSLKEIWMSSDGGSNFFKVDSLDPEDSTFNVSSAKEGDAYATVNSVPTPGSALAVSWENYSDSALTGNRYYRYKTAFKTADGETAPSSASKKLKTTANQRAIKIKLPETDDSNVTHVVLYRTIGYTNGNAEKVNGDYKKVIEIAIGTKSYIDKDVADGSLGSSPQSSTTTLHSYVDRFTCNGLLDTGNDQDDNIDRILSSCRGKLFDESGKYRVFIPKITVPETYELTEENIIGDWSFTIKGMSDRPNVVKASYINPKAEWKSDTVIWPKKDAENYYLKDDNNHKKILDLDLPFTTNRKIAQTICQVRRKEARNNIIAEVTVKESARVLRGGCLVKVTHSVPGWTQKKFWIDGMGFFPDGTIRVVLVEYTEDDYNYETLEEDTLPGADTDLGDPTDVPDEITNVEFAEESYVTKGITYWKLKVTFDNPTSAFWKQSNVYVKVGDGDYSQYTTVDKSSGGVLYIDNIQEGIRYYLKALSVSTLGASYGIDDEQVTEWYYDSEGTLGNPADVVGFNVKVSDTTVTLSWLKSTETDFSHYEIKRTLNTQSIPADVAWDEATDVDKPKGTSVVLIDVEAGAWKYWIRAFDKKGNGSANAIASSTVTIVGSDWNLILSDNLSAGTYDGAMYVNDGTYGNIARTQASNLTNPGFETGNATGWTLGLGWQVTSDDWQGGSYCARITGGVTREENSYQVVSGIIAGKEYIFKMWVKSNCPNCARIGINIDGTTIFSNFHPGDSQWHLLWVTKTCGTPIGSPKAYLSTIGAMLFFTSDYVKFDSGGFARYSGTYISSAHDYGSSAERTYKLDFRTVHTDPSPAPAGTFYIDLGVSTNGSDYTWYSGLESGQITATGRYRKFKIRFVGVWVNEVLYVRNYDGTYVKLYDAEVPVVESEWTEDTGTGVVYPNATNTKLSVGSTSALASVYVKEYSGQSVPLGRWDTSAGAEVASVQTNGLIKTSVGLKGNSGVNLSVSTPDEINKKISFIVNTAERAYVDAAGITIDGALQVNGTIFTFSGRDLVLAPYTEAGRKISFKTSNTERMYINNDIIYLDSDVTITGTLNLGPVLFSSIMSPSGSDLLIKTYNTEGGHRISFLTAGVERLYINDNATRIENNLNLNGYLNSPSGVDVTIKTWAEAERKISFYTGVSSTERLKISDSGVDVLQNLTVNASLSSASGTSLTLKTVDGEAGRSIYIRTNSVNVIRIQQAIITITGSSIATDSAIGSSPGVNLLLKTPDGDSGRAIQFYVNSSEKAYINNSGMRVNGVLSVNGSVTSPTSTTLLIQPSSGASLQLKAPDGESGQKISFYQNSSERAYIDNSNFRINTNISLNGELVAATGLTLNTRADSKISWWIGGVEKFYVDTSGVRYYNVTEVRFYSQAWLTGTPNLRINTEGNVQIWKDQTTQLVRITDSYFDIYLNTIRLRNSRTISSTSEFGNQGDICWNSSYLFICVASSSWKRIPLGW